MRQVDSAYLKYAGVVMGQRGDFYVNPLLRQSALNVFAPLYYYAVITVGVIKVTG